MLERTLYTLRIGLVAHHQRNLGIRQRTVLDSVYQRLQVAATAGDKHTQAQWTLRRLLRGAADLFLARDFPVELFVIAHCYFLTNATILDSDILYTRTVKFCLWQVCKCVSYCIKWLSKKRIVLAIFGNWQTKMSDIFTTTHK